jgi:hypothetical protein
LVSAVAVQLPPATCAALDALIQTEPTEREEYQAPLFPVRSARASLKEDAGATRVETFREESEKHRAPPCSWRRWPALTTIRTVADLLQPVVPTVRTSPRRHLPALLAPDSVPLIPQ